MMYVIANVMKIKRHMRTLAIEHKRDALSGKHTAINLVTASNTVIPIEMSKNASPKRLINRNMLKSNFIYSLNINNVVVVL